MKTYRYHEWDTNLGPRTHGGGTVGNLIATANGSGWPPAGLGWAAPPRVQDPGTGTFHIGAFFCSYPAGRKPDWRAKPKFKRLSLCLGTFHLL